MMLLPATYKKSLIALLVLLLAVIAGNYFKLSLFFGVDFLFGSIAVLIIIYLFGTGWGVFAACITGIQTILLLNHPYAAIVYICEALFVGLLLRRQQQNILLLDTLYWLLIGMPLIWLLSSIFLHLEFREILLIMLKQAVNGICNALIATLITTYLPVTQWLRNHRNIDKISLEKNLVNILTSFVFFPLLILIILDGSRVTNHINHDIQFELNSTSTVLVNALQSWYQQRISGLEKLVQITIENNLKTSVSLQRNTEIVQSLFADLDNIQINDAVGNTIAFAPTTQQNLATRVDKRLSARFPNSKALISNVHTDSILSTPHIDLTVPIVVENRFSGSVNSVLNLKRFSSLIGLNNTLGQQQIAIFDDRDRIITTTNLTSWQENSTRRSQGEVIQINDTLYNWLPKGTQPPIVRWQQSLYGQKVLVNNPPWRIVVELPAQRHVRYIENLYINDLLTTLVVGVVAIISAMIISRQIVKPLAKLAVVTNNLSHKVTQGERVNWFDSSIVEIDTLLSNFKLMSSALNDKFWEIKNINASLTQEVQERTTAVVKVEQQLVTKITQHQQTEEALQETEARYWDLFENANDLIQSVTPEGRFMYVNRAWREALGYSAAEVAHLSVFDIIDCNSQAHCMEIFAQVMSGKKIDKVEADFVTKDGRKIVVEGSVNCKFIDGKPVSTRSIFRDITERKQAEAEIQYVLKKERELGELKSRFISIASHEFRTPLTIIFMSIKLIEQFGQQATEEQKKLYFERIKAAIKRMTNLLDDILVISKSESGKLSCNPIHLAVNKFCNELVDEIRLSLGSDRTIIFISQGDDTNAYLDENLLRHILTNLLSNAIKYSPQGGDVSLHLTCTPKKAIFAIKDSGIGIPPADVEKLFGSFHRGSNVNKIPGTGLGLSIVKQCIDLHGGTITVGSEVGAGTTFTVTLPFIRN